MITTYINENRCFTFLEQLGESAPFGSQCLLTRRGPKYKMRQAVRNRNASFSLYQLKAEKKKKSSLWIKAALSPCSIWRTWERKSCLCAKINSSCHYRLTFSSRSTRWSKGIVWVKSKPANEIYREESEVYYQPFKTMFQATIGGQKRLLFFFVLVKNAFVLVRKRKKVGMFSVWGRTWLLSR